MQIVFSLFSPYFISSGAELKYFSRKRFQWLLIGDQDVERQVTYSVQLERIPMILRSRDTLTSYFENLYPGEIYAVELVLNIPSVGTKKVEILTDE